MAGIDHLKPALVTGFAAVLVAGLSTNVVAPLAALLAVLGLTLGILLARRGSPGRSDALAPIGRELARARRREEEADVVMVGMGEGRHGAPGALAAALRITDGLAMARHRHGWELWAVIPEADCASARYALERRVRRVATGPVAIGWARFPADGVTLDALCARARLEAGPAVLPAPEPRRPAQRFWRAPLAAGTDLASPNGRAEPG